MSASPTIEGCQRQIHILHLQLVARWGLFKQVQKKRIIWRSLVSNEGFICWETWSMVVWITAHTQLIGAMNPINERIHSLMCVKMILFGWFSALNWAIFTQNLWEHSTSKKFDLFLVHLLAMWSSGCSCFWLDYSSGFLQTILTLLIWALLAWVPCSK